MAATTQCRNCASEIPGNSRFCLSCGRPVDTAQPTAKSNDPLATQTVATGGSAPISSSSASSSSASRLRASSSSTSSSDGRFPPGTLLAQRYRIIAKLGQGGMGEVYRADDLVLGQAVALKFLPAEAVDNPSALDRFRNEVRIARQVSHPNVCRVYDLGELDGQLFLSMEYVDGEDLGGLLKRIGRLPEDKALEISRKLCAGLAAAHEKGVLHRDLKPGNVMLDSKGHVLITDFGLAALANGVSGSEVRNGTPAYMAPEQLEGKEVTVRSEIYSLGLVLYEIFTGKRPFESSTLADLVRTRNESTPASPSSLVRDMDPAVERVILRCLERDPAHRPLSALAVAAALGGDRLAAALAAGETPSPQMVAAAGDSSGLSPKIAVACLAFVIVGLIPPAVIQIRNNPFEAAHSENSPEVLRQKSREVLARLGYAKKPADSGEGFSYNQSFLRYVHDHSGMHPDWDNVLVHRPRVVLFWYRDSPQPMIPDYGFIDDNLTPGILLEEQPVMDVPGMTLVNVDDQGRLTHLEAIPPQLNEPLQQPSPPDWNALFSTADLDISKFTQVEPLWTSLAASDARAAWTGVWPGTEYPLRIEAAAWRGKPVFFKMIGPWTKPTRMEGSQRSAGEKAQAIILVCLLLVLITVPVWLARRNLMRGKADRRGAFRLSLAIFCLHMLIWLLRGHFAASFALMGLFVHAIAVSLFQAGMVWLIYLALEPYVRRHWPQTIISWSRLLAGRIRDAAVGRDVLFGVALGVSWMAIFAIESSFLHAAGAIPGFGNTNYLMGARSVLGTWLAVAPGSVRATLVFFFLLFVLKALLRNQWLAGAAFVVLWVCIDSLGGDHPAITVPAAAAIYGIAAVAVLRFGLVTLAVAIFMVNTMGSVAITANPSAWYFGSGVFVVGFVIALAAWAFQASVAGKKLFAGDLFE